MRKFFWVITAVIGLMLFNGQFFNETYADEDTAATLNFELVKDINPGYKGSDIYLGEGNGRIFFLATDDTHGPQIWTSNGTTAGTMRMTDLDKSEYYISSSTSHLTVNGIYFFSIRRLSDNGYELWRSDGTLSGTHKLINIPDYLDPQFKSAGSGGLYYFVPWSDKQYGRELWVSDGSISGTRMVKDINPGTGGSSPHNLTPVNDILFFLSGNDLWKSDGTSAGTVLVANFEEHYTKDMRYITHVNGVVYLAYLTNGNYELWQHDSIFGQTVLVKHFDGFASDSQSYTAVGDILYFAAKGSGSNTYDLWKSDGSPGGTVLVKNIGAKFPPYFDHFTNVNGTLFFTTRDGDDLYGTELWKSDGTADGTFMVKDITEGSYGSQLNRFTAIGNRLFFTQKETDYVSTLWMSDGTQAGTIKTHMGVSSLRDKLNFNEQLYFYGVDRRKNDEGKAYSDIYGTELYKYNPSASAGPKININDIVISGTKEVGSPVTFTMNTQNSLSNLVNYRYSVHPDYGTSGYDGLHWSSMTSTEYTTQNSIGYTFNKAGKYIVVVWAKNDISDSNTGVEIIGSSIDIKEKGEIDDACKIDISGISLSGKREVGSPVTFTLDVSNSCSDTVNYRFSYHGEYGTDAYDGLNWKSMTGTEYTTDNSIAFTFENAGKYIVVVWAKNDISDSNTDVELIGISVDIDENGEEPYFPF